MKVNNELELKGSFKYEITPDDKEWIQLDSKQKMVDACRIPEDVLSRMTTEEVIKAVMDFPLLTNLYAYNTYEAGLNALAEDSDAFRELIKRLDAAEKLINRLNSKAVNASEEEYSFEQETLTLLLVEETINSQIDDEEMAAKLKIKAENIY